VEIAPSGGSSAALRGAGGDKTSGGGAPANSSSMQTTSTGGLGGACQDGFIELMGGGGPLLEAVCFHGQEETTRPVGYFFFNGPAADGTFVIDGCGLQGSGASFYLKTPSVEPGVPMAGTARYEADGTLWLNEADAVSITIGTIGKVGTTVEGSYTASLFNGGESVELFGNFRVCHVPDFAAP